MTVCAQCGAATRNGYCRGCDEWDMAVVAAAFQRAEASRAAVELLAECGMSREVDA